MAKRRARKMVIFSCGVQGEEGESISVQREDIRCLRIIQDVSPKVPDWISTRIYVEV